jgi:hypothetical protein
MKTIFTFLCFTFLPLALLAQEDVLKKSISADYEEIDLEKALKNFRKESKISMVIDPSLNLKQDVNIMVDKAPAFQVLNWLTQQTNLAYVFEEGVLIMMSHDEKEKRRRKIFRKEFVSQEYYIGDLLGTLQDFEGPSLTLGDEGEGILVTEAEGPAEPLSGDDIMELIEATVAPDSWQDAEISMVANKLVIKNSVANQKKIQALLQRLKKAQSVMVQNTVKICQLTTKEVNKLSKEINKLVLTEKGEELLKEYDLVNILQGTGFSTQRISFLDVTSQAYLRDYSVVANKGVGILDPEIGILASGLNLDLRCTVSADKKSVRVDLLFEKSKLKSTKDFTIKNSKDEKQSLKLQLAVLHNSQSNGTLRLPANKWYVKVLGKEEGQYQVAFMKFEVIEQ